MTPRDRAVVQACVLTAWFFALIVGVALAGR